MLCIPCCWAGTIRDTIRQEGDAVIKRIHHPSHIISKTVAESCDSALRFPILSTCVDCFNISVETDMILGSFSEADAAGRFIDRGVNPRTITAANGWTASWSGVRLRERLPTDVVVASGLPYVRVVDVSAAAVFGDESSLDSSSGGMSVGSARSDISRGSARSRGSDRMV